MEGIPGLVSILNTATDALAVAAGQARLAAEAHHAAIERVASTIDQEHDVLPFRGGVWPPQ